MSNLARYYASHVLYAIGHYVSLPMVKFDWSYLHPLYNRLMLASVAVQGKGEGPWYE